MAGWSSGWVAATGNNTSTLFNHTLNSTDVMWQIYVAEDDQGLNAITMDVQFDYLTSASDTFGAMLTNITETSFNLQLGAGYLKDMFNHAELSFVGKYVKVVATAAISDPVPGTGDLCKILSEDSGYQMFRNGLTIQWMSSAAFTAQDQSQSVDFPIAFAAKPFKVVASTRNPEGTGNSGAIIIETTNWTKTSVTLMSQAEGDTPRPNRPYFADIIAIGIAEVTDCPGSTDPNDPSDPEGTKISQLTSATSLKDNDLFVISKENTGDSIYDISQKVTLSELSNELISKIPPTPVSSNFIFIDPVEIYSHAGFVTLPWTTKDLSAHIPEGATGCIINITYGISGPDDGVPAKTLLRAKSGGFVYTAIFAGSWAGGDSIGGNSQGLYPINVETRSIDISIPVRSPNYQNVYLIGYF